MLEEQICHKASCFELANYHCKLCSAVFCSEHLCSHLSVAWESNTWTSRNTPQFQSQGDEYDNKTVRTERDRKFENEPAISSDAISLESYSIPELQEKYNLYLSLAREFRDELEKREVFGSSLPTSYLPPFYAPRESRKLQNIPIQSRTRPKVLSKKLLSRIELLANSIRDGTISFAEVEAKLKT